MGNMYKIKRHLPLEVQLQISHSFVQIHLNFCSLVWGYSLLSRPVSLSPLFCLPLTMTKRVRVQVISLGARLFLR